MIDTIFNCIHLLIVLAFFIYAFYKYIIPEAKIAIIEYSNYLNKLKNDKKTAILAQKNIDLQIAKEELKYLDVKSKISLWTNSNSNLVKQEILENKNLYIKLEQKVLLQSTIYKNSMIHKQIAPALIENLEQKFHKYFENNDNNYISKILNKIEQK